MQVQKPSRKLSPYEKTQLLRARISEKTALSEPDKPVEYITGKVDFFSHSFQVTQDTLIPRPESEELITKALEWFEKNRASFGKKPPVILDIGTGCGAIAISLALELQKLRVEAEITATDISAGAIAVAKQNAVKHNVPTITWVSADLLDFLPASAQVDLLIANLPYIPSERIAYLDASVKDFEPKIALDGGSDGLHHIRKLLNEAHQYLTPIGTILLEVDYTHGETIRQEFNRTWQVQTWQSSISACTFAQFWPLTNNAHPAASQHPAQAK
ncbi:peptide chain release factor N(5)-glutamine methyltransferase [Candidatus Woesebacteria bacterium]|nr:peptide chain release factor N(5)-glutamine methyltransferase [Candidatus Woesebacteria bacterium]